MIGRRRCIVDYVLGRYIDYSQQCQVYLVYGDRICDLVDSRLDLKVSLYSYDVLL